MCSRAPPPAEPGGGVPAPPGLRVPVAPRSAGCAGRLSRLPLLPRERRGDRDRALTDPRVLRVRAPPAGLDPARVEPEADEPADAGGQRAAAVVLALRPRVRQTVAAAARAGRDRPP